MAWLEDLLEAEVGYVDDQDLVVGSGIHIDAGEQMMTVTLSASPEEFDALVQKETGEWAKVVHENQVTID